MKVKLRYRVEESKGLVWISWWDFENKDWNLPEQSYTNESFAKMVQNKLNAGLDIEVVSHKEHNQANINPCLLINL